MRIAVCYIRALLLYIRSMFVFKRRPIFLLTLNINASHLFFHGVGVNLAHVATTIGFFELPDSQLPSAQVVVRHTDASIVCYDPRVEGQDCLIFGFHPADLEPTKMHTRQKRSMFCMRLKRFSHKLGLKGCYSYTLSSIVLFNPIKWIVYFYYILLLIPGFPLTCIEYKYEILLKHLY